MTTTVQPNFRERANANDVPVARLIGFQTKDIRDVLAEVTLSAGRQLCEGETFCVDPSWLLPPSSSPTSPIPTTPTIPFAADLAERERAMIENALREAEGLISGPAGAAAKLGLPRQTLETKIRKLGVDWHRFRTS
jgi:transcriptional regulator with GAF, ATPase, and Fis domain